MRKCVKSRSHCASTSASIKHERRLRVWTPLNAEQKRRPRQTSCDKGAAQFRLLWIAEQGINCFGLFAFVTEIAAVWLYSLLFQISKSKKANNSLPRYTTWNLREKWPESELNEYYHRLHTYSLNLRHLWTPTKLTWRRRTVYFRWATRYWPEVMCDGWYAGHNVVTHCMRGTWIAVTG